MTFTLPTLLTFLRIALVPVLVLAFYTPLPVWGGPLCAAIFGLAALTDWLDGFLARLYQQTSAFGAFLDPVADKIMVAAALVLLVESEQSVWVTLSAIVIVGREITISALREWMATIGSAATVAVSWLGKVKTTLQMIAILLLLYREPLLGVSMRPLGLLLLVLSALLTLLSMLHYLRLAWPEMRRS